jgi:hypothetical protein
MYDSFCDPLGLPKNTIFVINYCTVLYGIFVSKMAEYEYSDFGEKYPNTNTIYEHEHYPYVAKEIPGVQ